MEESLVPTPSKNAIPKEVFKDLSLERRISGGRDSPESGSLYSDYESGQQYEDKDLPSGYNSGEQYDTLSTGYMSGEAYELPEARPEPLEPTLASIEEVSTRSNEEMFTLAMPPPNSSFPENNLLAQMEVMDSSSSGSMPDNLELASALDPVTNHKIKRKKTVSYHISVPIEKSPLGHDINAYREIPSDTDTTSCFDSDGTYMRSEGQSSDSGAALLHHSNQKTRKGKDRRPSEPGIIKGSKKRLRKAKNIIRSHEDFFMVYDNKHWANARKICFWFSVLSILGSIVAAGIMIILMPKSCDPVTAWWQGKVILDIIPINSTSGQPKINLTDLILNVPKFKEIGIQAIKLKNIYRQNPDDGNDPLSSLDGSVWYSCTDDNVLRARLDVDLLSTLSQELHKHEMNLMVEIPAFEEITNHGMMSLFLIQNVTIAIKNWGEVGVDGISIIGLEHFGKDPYIATTAESWKTNFLKYGTSPNTKILTTSYLLPQNIEATATEEKAKETVLSGFAGIVSFDLLDATITLDSLKNNEDTVQMINNAANWDLAPSQPWINWNIKSHGANLKDAEIAFHMLLPGTLNLQLTDIDLLDVDNQLLVSKLIAIRQTAVPIFMNGNFKTCHGHCDGTSEKELNYKVHVLEDNLILLERHFSRRNRYMVIANLGNNNASLLEVSSLYSGGDMILDTSDLKKESEFVKFKDAVLASNHAFVIKFPK
eukprot:GFUD01042925.1.p1 GENE.GFUD01042925.1~~GFUD01042925.1.p1  ORF type:complete len:710 (-),score=133.40 GFUD01042925.1:683-2812(-)